MKVKVDISAAGRTRWFEYLVRFFFGGAVTVLAGVIAKTYGPGIGGLFLAFPAIFPATATLIEKHEKQKKEQAGKDGIVRAREAAGADAAGAAMGSVGLVVFAAIVWYWLPNSPLTVVVGAATVAWLLVAVIVWELRETLWRHIRLKLRRQVKPQGGPQVR